MAKKTKTNKNPNLEAEESRVTSLELFFDLVFVFTLTQLTALLARSLSWESLLQSFLIFIVLFWMYGGYVWLTNSIPPVTPGRQILLIAGMAAFLICALAIPDTFNDTGLIFGIGYLIVIIVHGFMYVRAVGLNKARFVPMNFLSAGAIISAGLADGSAQYLLWLLAIALHVVTSFLGAGLRFELRVSHFTERHGLLLLVALGESIVAIGVGVHVLDLRSILAAVLGLILTAVLWWIYFAHDDDAARSTMLARPNSAQLRQALSGYFYAFVPMLFGIILLATGIESSIEHLTSTLDTAHAFTFGGGVGLYLIGTVIFRRASGIPEVTYRYIAACLAVLTGFIGNNLYAALQFACLILILILLVIAESNKVFSRAHQ
ncbi:MAG TPA: low temperature requirement protein A [Anaerolineales bacterium]|jgi:low temperature requirement protein LtrA|nr:low temperature requirement protein A [Anaerolineales bacterium]